MTAEDRAAWDRIEPILERALDLPTSDRAAFLDGACGSDRAFRARVEGMLRAGEDPDGALERSIVEVAGPLLLELDAVDAPTIAPGETIGAWRVVRELGHGGMGDVFLAERADGQFAQTAALKLVRRGREHDPLLVRRFLEERRILASLAHPNVARLLDGGVTSAGLPWFAMEYVAGRPLDRYCDERHLDVPARLALMEQVVAAVAYAHRNLLVHRDLKPSNIFVTDDGDVKLLDFGIAKLLGEENLVDPRLTLGDGRVMTPEYAAPEQVRGEPITTATDIYSLGAVFYQLLTGQRAHRFDKTTAAEIERVVCETDPEAPRLSSDVDTILLTALQKDPARRYASADAMLDDLRRFRTGRPILAHPDSVRYRLGKFVGRHRVSVAASIVVVLALAGGIVATVWQARVAHLEAVRADRVKTFLIDMLNETDPRVTQGAAGFSVQQLLDRGTRRVDSTMGREPAVQAELYEVLGNTYAHLNLLNQADSVHRKGLAIERRLYGPGNPDVLNQTMAVGWDLNDRGKYADADTLLTAAIADYRAAGGKPSQALSDALDILATAKKRSDHPVESESLYRQSLRLQIQLTGPTDTITASRLSDLAALLGGQDRLAAADSELTAAQALRRITLPPLDLKYLVGESSLAMIRMKRGDLAAAEPRLRTAVAGLVQIEKPGGLNAARSLDRLAMLESLRFHTRASIATGEQAFAMFRDAMGADHPETFNSLSLLAQYRANIGDPSATNGARTAYDGLQRTLGSSHDWTLAAGQRLAAAQLESGNVRAAGALASTLLASVRGKHGGVPPAFARLLAIEASLRVARGDSAGADRTFREALDALATGTHLDSAVFPSIAARYGAFLTARKDSRAAEALLRRALAFIPDDADSSTVVLAQLRAALARARRQAANHRVSEGARVFAGACCAERD